MSLLRRLLRREARFHRVSGSRPGARNGFTLIEVMMVAAIVSLLAALSQPALQRVLIKARAAEAFSNLNAIKVAIQQYESDYFTYPPDANRGEIPSELVDYLPEGFSFTYDGYVLDYDNYMGPNGQPVDDGTFSIGLTVIPDDEQIGQAMVALIGSKVWPRGDNKFTWVVID